MLKRALIRLGIACGVMGAAAFGGLSYWSAGQTLCPQRRVLQDYHQEILAHPVNFGLSIRTYIGPDRTPCLLVEPASDPGVAKKGRIVRQLLERDGFSLSRWGEVKGTVVLLHGHKGRKEDHLPVAERFCAAGFRCLIPDLPGHGENPDLLATFGTRECRVIEKLLDDLWPRFSINPESACLFGLSQGGAIALQTAAGPGNRWAAVASVAAFASLDLPISRQAERLTGPLAPVTAGACGIGMWCRGGFFPYAVSPVSAASKLRMPVFIGHGNLDTFIDPAQARAIYQAVPHDRKVLRIVEDGNHHNVLAKGSHELYAEICGFFLKSIGK